MCGEGGVDADVMFIGIGPGRDEDRIGRPFVGPSGEWFDRILSKVGLERDEVYVTNLVKCRPFTDGRNRDPSRKELNACRRWLDAEIELVKPKIVVLFGGLPLQELIGLQGIKKKRGQTFYTKETGHRLYFAMLHPAVLVRDEAATYGPYKSDVRELVRLIRRLMPWVERRKQRPKKTAVKRPLPRPLARSKSSTG